MNDSIRAMLKKYGPLRDRSEEENALKEILQQIALSGLHRGGFFDKAAFYGGTALRVLYNLDRFSEDMDFCLEHVDPAFSFRPFLNSVTTELARYGFNAQVEEKRSGVDVAVNSAFVRQDTLGALLPIGRSSKGIHKKQLLKIKLEVDKLNPKGAQFCNKLILLPTPFMVRTLSESSLFSGKLHAVLARSYQNRVKGRDFYDFIFYCSRGTGVNLIYLEAKLRNSGHYFDTTPLTLERLIALLDEKFSQVHFDKAKEDVAPFLKVSQRQDLKNWNYELFSAMAQQITVEA
ncbi:MAG: nucleotidyl transferase AbiEii/AbiGii toxin family protein [Planctomycetes bacterium]|nr:nucleotidyl transferase AbiEii/AbiGii toxin family protein [Planctomycetota bacterium]